MALTARAWTISAAAVELAETQRAIGRAVVGLQPVGRRGKAQTYRLADIVGALYRADADGTKRVLADATSRRAVAQANLTELEVLKQTGQVVAIDVVAAEVGEQLGRVRTRLLAIPHKVAPLVAPETTTRACQQILARAVDEALAELSGFAAERAAEAGQQEAEGRRKPRQAAR